MSERVQNLREINIQKDILKDITAAEFAIRLEVKHADSKIDYDMLISNLDRGIDILKTQQNNKSKMLMTRVMDTKSELMKIKISSVSKSSTTSSESTSVSAPIMSSPTSTTIAQSNTSPGTAPPRLQEIRENLKLIVREDGTVDWEEAIASSKEVAKFGTELWERINGRDEGQPSLGELLAPMQSKVIETEEIKRLNEMVQMAQKELDFVAKERDQLKSKLRDRRKQGDTVLASDVDQLQRLELSYKERAKRVRLFTLNYDIERICAYLAQEIESSAATSATVDQRTLIAEVALIDKQLTSILAGLQVNVVGSPRSAEANSAMTVDTLQELLTDADLVSLIDDDELTLICNEVSEMKSQLGLGPQVGGAMDWGSLGVLASDSLAKIKQGLSFYGEGTKILVNDIQYAAALITRAAQGYTLKPREVNSLRRTGKDLLTLIPFTIILIIPLSPIGHVLVFSFIQRYFPNFFPTCYTEKRLNLKSLLAEIERKNLDDIIGTDEEATGFTGLPGLAPLNQITDAVKNFWNGIVNTLKPKEETA